MRNVYFILIAFCLLSFSKPKEKNDLEMLGLRGQVKQVTWYVELNVFDELKSDIEKWSTTFFNQHGNKVWELVCRDNDTLYTDTFLYDRKNRLQEVQRRFYPELNDKYPRNSYLHYDKEIYTYKKKLLVDIRFIIPPKKDMLPNTFHFVYRYDKKGRLVEKRDMSDTREILRVAYAYPSKFKKETWHYQFSKIPHWLEVDSLNEQGELIETKTFRPSEKNDSLWRIHKVQAKDLQSILYFDSLQNLSEILYFNKDGTHERRIVTNKNDKYSNWLERTYTLSGKIVDRYTRVIEYY